MASVETYAKELLQVSKLAEDFQDSLRTAMGGSFSWGVKEVVASYLFMFDRFCPFSVGDRVMLTMTPKVEDTGWEHCGHFLQEGAVGTVVERGYGTNQFTFDVEFDNETWIDSEGNYRPVNGDKHTFRFGEKRLTKAVEEELLPTPVKIDYV